MVRGENARLARLCTDYEARLGNTNTENVRLGNLIQ